MKNVYITRTSSFLPNDPVSNEEIEDVLGKICDTNSRAKKIVLRNNKIKKRYYCYDRNGELKYNNAELTREAIVKLMNGVDLKLSEVDLLCTATSTPDQIAPSHASMVHGLLPEMGPVEIHSPSGICASSIQGLQSAYAQILSGLSQKAICTGSEVISTTLRGDFFETQYRKLEALSSNPYIGFEKDFLRFMLSDGAGAFLLENEPNGDVNYKIEWIEGRSYAHKYPTCMYQGCLKDENDKIVSWRGADPKSLIEDGYLSLKQDVKILEKNVMKLGAQTQLHALEKHNFSTDDIDYYLPHISSMYFKEKLYNALLENKIPIPSEKWFLNLPDIGNIGSASIFCLLDDLAKQRDLKKGEKVLLGIPESGRFNYYLVLLTVV